MTSRMGHPKSLRLMIWNFSLISKNFWIYQHWHMIHHIFFIWHRTIELSFESELIFGISEMANNIFFSTWCLKRAWRLLPEDKPLSRVSRAESILHRILTSNDAVNVFCFNLKRRWIALDEWWSAFSIVTRTSIYKKLSILIFGIETLLFREGTNFGTVLGQFIVNPQAKHSKFGQ